MLDYHFDLPVRLYTGEGCVARDGKEMKALGSRCLLVTGGSGAKKSGALDDVIAVLNAEGITWEQFDGIRQNPLLSTCKEAGDRARAMGAQFIVGIGGGSPLDAAKAVAVFAANDIPAMDIYKKDWANRPLPIVLVGTTAGTGSEMTTASVLSIDATGEKKSVSHHDLYAAISYGDPRYTHSLPYNFTIGTALDALCHAIEGYFSSKASAFSDLFALEAVRLLTGALREVEGRDAGEITPSQRERLYYGSLCGGMTISVSGTGFCHPMGYFLSEEYGAPHGTACAVFLPDYIRRAAALCPDKAARLWEAADMPAEDLAQFIHRINAYTPPAITESKLESLIQRWHGVKNFTVSPGELTDDDRRRIARQNLTVLPD